MIHVCVCVWVGGEGGGAGGGGGVGGCVLRLSLGQCVCLYLSFA